MPPNPKMHRQKKYPQNFRDCLATYLERIHNLENEISRKNVELEITQETHKREVQQLKNEIDKLKHQVQQSRETTDELNDARAEIIGTSTHIPHQDRGESEDTAGGSHGSPFIPTIPQSLSSSCSVEAGAYLGVGFVDDDDGLSEEIKQTDFVDDNDDDGLSDEMWLVDEKILDAVRLDGTLHLPYKTEIQSECLVCSNKYNRHRTIVRCTCCPGYPHLHIGDCFRIFHSILEYKACKKEQFDVVDVSRWVRYNNEFNCKRTGTLSVQK